MIRQIGERDVQEEQKDKERERHQRVRISRWENDLQHGVEGIEAVLGEIRPRIECPVKPRWMDDRPEDNGDQERKRGDRCVVEAVEGAQTAGPAVEEHRAACERVAGGVDACE